MKYGKILGCAFHVAIIISGIALTGCGYKGPPVYKVNTKESNKTIDYNSTQPVIPSNLNQY